MSEVKSTEPLEMKVNPHRWTTKVNVAMVLAVIAVLLIGAGFAIYATMNPRAVHQEIHEEVTP